MPTFIEMPKLSDTMTEGTLLQWHVKEGDAVRAGQVIADVETDKATMEMEAFDAGTVGRIYVPAGGRAPLGAILMALVAEGEEAPEVPPTVAAAAPASPAAATPSAAPSRAAAVPAAVSVAPVVALTTSGGRVKASPLARKIAGGKGVNLNTIAGTGPGGRIVARDVVNAPANGSATVVSGPAPRMIRPVLDFDPKAERIPLTGMRNIIADRLLVSKTTIPHFYLNVELDAVPLMKLRKQVNDTVGADGNKFTVNDFILKAMVLACVDVPEVNAAFDLDAIIRYQSVNIAVAIAVPDGLVTPVIRNAQAKSMLELSKAVKVLAEKAKSKKLSPDDFAGGTITVSNLGAYGVDNFDAIINPPQAAILAIGSIRNVPVVSESGSIVPGQRMWVGMSCDHRVIDGAVGATYLQALRKYIENPALMLV
ncbi:MAG: pyruvate dehydrogenase E2 component (dihydrolipoamide acetyltransferase) [Verrucomicrobia bacterium]|jgi:pyruvate dehydrogenase E2 component (dihydrolipoamide acetyltransferase)|nr:MAG: pyruvate dehydrogenase E2 component (dihydrolipoamide acetyltransferase) [Verrucomicrobiota bacterium]